MQKYRRKEKLCQDESLTKFMTDGNWGFLFLLVHCHAFMGLFSFVFFCERVCDGMGWGIKGKGLRLLY